MNQLHLHDAESGITDERTTGGGHAAGHSTFNEEPIADMHHCNVRDTHPVEDGNGDHDPGDREAKIREYVMQSLRITDALRANVGLINSDLMSTAAALQQAVQAAMVGGPLSLEQLAEIEPALNILLRVVRQVDRFAQLEMRARKSEGGPCLAAVSTPVQLPNVDWDALKARHSGFDTQSLPGGQQEPNEKESAQ